MEYLDSYAEACMNQRRQRPGDKILPEIARPESAKRKRQKDAGQTQRKKLGEIFQTRPVKCLPWLLHNARIIFQ